MAGKCIDNYTETVDKYRGLTFCVLCSTGPPHSASISTHFRTLVESQSIFCIIVGPSASPSRQIYDPEADSFAPIRSGHLCQMCTHSTFSHKGLLELDHEASIQISRSALIFSMN